MDDKKIKRLATFFYSSDDSNDVPVRIAISTGQYTGHDLTKKDFIALFRILNNSKRLKADLLQFKGSLELE